jgi:hypothetical protein
MPITTGTYTMTSDGTKFFDAAGKAEALEHEAKLDEARQVERFLASKTWERGQATRARSIIGEFVEFQRGEVEATLDRLSNADRITPVVQDDYGLAA